MRKIISGGQTGVDRAALDASLEASFPIGGCCPRGRTAEDGPIDMKYPLAEIAGGYRQRTRKNVEAADGTVIFYQSVLSGGTELTLSFCMKLQKPYKLVDLDQATPQKAIASLTTFLNQHDIEVLNIAGPQSSSHPDIYLVVKQIVLAVIDHQAPVIQQGI